ncbi:MAG: hypothetical protein DHS20C01_13190 [marine bacterium B5-7]|nr:MAG: hypothetical protein DHS20C01_13190 [marine bacterium B5-7]
MALCHDYISKVPLNGPRELESARFTILLISTLKRLMEYKTYMCVICGYVYDEEQGAPEDGLAPRTRWEDVPATWRCPDCEATKEDFELIEI